MLDSDIENNKGLKSLLRVPIFCLKKVLQTTGGVISHNCEQNN